MQKFILIFGLIFFSLGIGKGLYFLKDGFSSRRIHSLDEQSSFGWDEKAKQAVQQTFYYIGRGRQCFAFGSADGKYVLKFPRTDIYATPFWARVLPIESYRKKLKARRKAREEFIRESILISYHALKEQTGLIAIHLGQTEPTQEMLTVVDAAGATHRLPFCKTSFLLQHKHPILMQKFLEASQKGDAHTQEKILDALLDVILVRAKSGILNRDRSFLRNYGYDGEKAYQIDVGSFFRTSRLQEDAAYQKSVQDSIDPVQEWLAAHDPRMLTYLKKKLPSFL